MLPIEKFSFGVGDRFAHQAKAQLQACVQAAQAGIDVIPVWNKSNREHVTIGSEPVSLRNAADAAVQALGWTRPYHVDADHIGLETVDRFIPHSDFYTIDVADAIGTAADPSAINAFLDRHPELMGALEIAGIDQPFNTTRESVSEVISKYLGAAQLAGRIYQHIVKARGEDNFITEVSMDETDAPQTPPELLIILAALADENIPAQTIAPKFTGRFNKGVDYVGDVSQFEKEFNDDLCVLSHAINAYGLPKSLKLSVHSGSDKFSIYGPIQRGLRQHGAGLHLKTAGTTWLEELIGLAEAGGDGLALAQEIYGQAVANVDALCAPYAAVIDIDPLKLPSAQTVQQWSSQQYVSALRHDQKNPEFNPHLRQLLHVGYKIAAQMGDRYLGMLEACEGAVSKNVTENLFDRHIKPLFL
jgi:hypothetical protein